MLIMLSSTWQHVRASEHPPEDSVHVYITHILPSSAHQFGPLHHCRLDQHRANHPTSQQAIRHQLEDRDNNSEGNGATNHHPIQHERTPPPIPLPSPAVLIQSVQDNTRSRPGHEPARHFSRQARAFTIYFRARARSARAQA